MASLLVHAGAFFVAGLFVVFTVASKPDSAFQPPPPIERPKMKLKKPKVKIRKSSNPKPSSRIVSKVQSKKMPEIRLPDLVGIGEGLLEGSGGADGLFLDIPDIGNLSTFGNTESIGNDLVGTFYDLKRKRDGRVSSFDRSMFADVVLNFLRAGFDPEVLSKYYSSPNKLYTPYIMVPPTLSDLGPLAYGEPDIGGYLFLIHYTGVLVYPEDITFRFVGSSGDVLFAGLDGEVVLNAAWWSNEDLYCPWYKGSASSHRTHMLGFQRAAVGEWITLKAGEPRRIDVLMGEDPGGGFSAELLVEEKGVEYELNDCGAPILPIFKTSELSLDMMDVIYYEMVEDEACLTNGPVFCDFDSSRKSSPATPDLDKSIEDSGEPQASTRTWTSVDGKTIEAEFIRSLGDKVLLETAQGEELKLPLDQLCRQDREYVELCSPPTFDLDFSKKSDARPPLPSTPYLHRVIPPTLIDYIFTAKVKQTSVGVYNHPLTVEYFAIGKEVDGDNYILLDRQQDAFTPTRENNRSHSFSGPPVLCYDYDDYWRDRRGSKYGGYLVTLTDERGEIIAHATPHDWLFDHLEKLRNFPVGRHFNKSLDRVFPPRPVRKY